MATLESQKDHLSRASNAKQSCNRMIGTLNNKKQSTTLMLVFSYETMIIDSTEYLAELQSLVTKFTKVVGRRNAKLSWHVMLLKWGQMDMIECILLSSCCLA